MYGRPRARRSLQVLAIHPFLHPLSITDHECSGYGYQVRFVEYGTLPKTAEEADAKIIALNKNMAVTMEWAYQEIR